MYLLQKVTFVYFLALNHIQKNLLEEKQAQEIFQGFKFEHV